jgi:hypothetical protein
MEWTTIDRPGYFGARRDELASGWDAEYGAGNWRVAWMLDARSKSPIIIPREGMLMLYEDAYFEHFRAHQQLLEHLISEASDIYDDAPSNVASGFDYNLQETDRTHVQDIAIRRCLVRFGRKFCGDHLIQIRDSCGEHPLSIALSPGQVSFHQPAWIYAIETEGWWCAGSVESYYQSNKVLQVLAD